MKIWYCLLVYFFASGCVGINTTRRLTTDIKQNFTNRLEGGSTGLSNKIEINGYYRFWFKDEWGRYKTIPDTRDTSFVDMIFYEDGTFLYNMFVGSNFSNYNDYFRYVTSKGKNDIFYKSDSWGVYSISGDTIKTQFLMHAAHFTPWYTGERWFLIKDRRTLQLIFAGYLVNQTRDDAEKLREYVRNSSAVMFYPLDIIPPPYAWLKNEKFFWRHEADWENYKKAGK